MSSGAELHQMRGMQTMRPRRVRILFLLVRLVFALIFIGASLDKIAHPAEFAKIVSNYRVLPVYTVNFVAVVLPWLEAVIGLLILCGWWLTGAVLLANLLLICFFAALAQAAARGIDLHCGCFSSSSAGPSHMLLYLARDLLFLGLGAALLLLKLTDRQ